MEKIWLKAYDKPVPHSLAPYPNKPLHVLLEETATKYPTRACTIFKGATITYQQMNDYADRVAAGLAALGVKKEDRVGIVMPNVPQFVMAYFGVLKAGGVVVAINPTYPAAEMRKPLRDADIKVVLTLSKFYPTVCEARQDTPLKNIVVTNIKEALPFPLSLLFAVAREKKDGHHVAQLQPGDQWLKDWWTQYTPAQRPQVKVTGDDRALFQYSGGTTGEPKAAVALHRNIVANTLQLRAWLHDARDGEETMLMAIPLFHVYGMIAGLGFSVYTAARMVMVPDARDLKDVFANINKYQPTIFPGVPRLYNAINNHPDAQAGKVNLRSIRSCISGSAPLLLEIKTKFEALSGGKVFEGFGMSECPTAATCNPFMGQNKDGSVGIPLPDVEVRIVSLEDGVTEVPLGQEGELTVRGPQVMWGYHNDPTGTKNTLRDVGDGGGPWLFTGDIAKADEDGYLYLVDRKKELIKVGGFQVWPRDIEEVLAQHPAVLEAAAAGVPGKGGDEIAKAWVVLRPDQTATAEALQNFCKDKLAAYKVPREIEFIKELPRSQVFKVLRRELVRMHKEKQKAT
jgi:long-chain acyl-CoA synthetase